MGNANARPERGLSWPRVSRFDKDIPAIATQIYKCLTIVHDRNLF